MKKLTIITICLFVFVANMAAQSTTSEAARFWSGILDKGKLESISFYTALRDSRGRVKPDAKARYAEDATIYKGATLMGTKDRVTSFYPHNQQWMYYSWRADESYHPVGNFQKKTYQCVDHIIAKGMPEKMTFRRTDGEKIVIGTLNKDGHKVFDEEGNVITSPIYYYYNDGTRMYTMLPLEEGNISLQGCFLVISRTAGDDSDTEGLIVDGRLLSDAYVVSIGDPDFNTDLYITSTPGTILDCGYTCKYMY